MKFFAETESKKGKINNVPVLTYFFLSLLLVSLFILLTACDGRNTLSSTPISTTASVNQSNKSPAANTLTPVKPTVMAATAPTATAAPASPTAWPTASSGHNGSISTFSEPTATPGEASQPAISFSPEVAPIGESVEITGSGYPPNTRLNIQIATSDYKTLKTYSTVVTDEAGNFKTTLKLDGQAQGSYLTPGKLEIAITTPDGRIGASAPLALQPATNASSEQACINLIREFFATMKRDPQSAQVYLSGNLRGQLSGSKNSLPGLLGLQVMPFRVEIGKVEGSKTSYKATMYFSDGTQKVALLDVTNDVSGALKISTIKTK